MLRATLVFLLAATAYAEDADLIKDGEVAACAPVKEQAKEAVLDALGYAKGEALVAAREHCKKMAEADCTAAHECKYCADNTTCWPALDLDNPCDQGTLNNMLLAGEVMGEVGSAIGETTSSVLSKCNDNFDSEEDCPTLMCEWCEQTTSCHVYGAPQNQCLRDRLKDMAKEQSAAAADAAKAALSQELQDVMAGCANFNNNATGCGENRLCVYCGKDHNICYFMGDKTNKCIREEIQEKIDAVTGVAKPIGEWAGNTYTDMKDWSKGLCGDKTDESSCNNDAKCSWCGDSTSCHVYGSAGNKCGVIHKGAAAVKDKFTEVFGKSSACAADEVAARDAMKEGLAKAKANLQFACTEYMESKFYAQQSLTALQEDAGDASDAVKDSLSEMTSVKVEEAKNALKDAMGASNDTTSLQETLDAFDAANPCAAEETSGAQSIRLESFLLVAFAIAAWALW